MSSTPAARTTRTTSTRTAATGCIGREANAGTASNDGIGIGDAVEDAGAAANGDTAFERGRRGAADNKGIATARRSLKGNRLTADGQGVPGVLAP